MAGFMSSNTPMTICVYDSGGHLDMESLRKGAFSEAIDPEGYRSGWVGLGEVLDTENFFLASTDSRFSGFSFRLDVRKPSKAVINLQLAKKIRDEEANGHPVGIKRKRELKDVITETLTSQAEFVPSLTDCIWDSEKGRLFIATTSESLVEKILAHFHASFGKDGHLIETDQDMKATFSLIQNNNGVEAAGYGIQPVGSAALASIEENGEKSAVAVQNNSGAVSEALSQGMEINRIGLVATRKDSEIELNFTLASDLKISRLFLPKPEKGTDIDATFLINCEICASIADMVEVLSMEK